jgi:ketosteroid isomerase-like protein
MSHPKSLHASPDDAEQAFYDALENANLDALMDLWSEDDEVICIHPGGVRLVGLNAIRNSWKAMFANGPVHARRAQVQIAQASMVSVHSVIEQVIVAQKGATSVVNVYATNVYLKGPLGWRMVLHHASLTPQEQVVAVSGAPPKMLH